MSAEYKAQVCVKPICELRSITTKVYVRIMYANTKIVMTSICTMHNLCTKSRVGVHYYVVFNVNNY